MNTTTILFKNILVSFRWKYLVLETIDEKIKKVTIGVNFMRKLNLLLPRSSLLRVCKSFIRPHLDYGDVIYNQPNLSSLANKIESVQYIAALAITGATRGTFTEKLYWELGFESLKDRTWLRRLYYLYKILNTKQPVYLCDRHNSADYWTRYIRRKPLGNCGFGHIYWKNS